ncbi:MULTISPECIES: hypothetical protein [unclassified Streptomyces]|uniref:hypothetical protein n=1 Tax=Streptomyces TaxID=1883 RepID=UPI0010106EC9|nr:MULTISPECIES: hypothetical protein [unclassified Streptomyces]MDT0425473.1 hypothetical protein [Streptomyces sp. DSM 41859]
MVRNVLGGVLAVLGAAGAVASPFRPWYAARLGREYRLPDLFSSGGITAAHPNLLWSLFLPFLLAAALTLLGLLTRLRTPVLLAGVLALGFAVLWAVRAAQANGDSLTLAADGSGLRLGVAGAAGGGVLLLLAAGIMAGRVRRAPAPPPVPVPPPPPPAYTDGPDEDDWRAPASYGPTGANGTYGSSRPGPYGSPEPEPTTPLPTIRPQDR